MSNFWFFVTIIQKVNGYIITIMLIDYLIKRSKKRDKH